MEATPIKRAAVLTGRRIRLIGDFEPCLGPGGSPLAGCSVRHPVVVDLSECELLDGGLLALLLEEADGAGRVPRKCIRLNFDCADICDATERVMTRQTEYDAPTSKAILVACIEACATCGEECEKHASMHEHCRVCAEACRDCADACERLLEAMK